MKTIKRYYQINRKDISFLKFILEGYDGIAFLSTIDKYNGLIIIHIAPGCEKDFFALLESLKQNIIIEEILNN